MMPLSSIDRWVVLVASAALALASCGGPVVPGDGGGDGGSVGEAGSSTGLSGTGVVPGDTTLAPDTGSTGPVDDTTDDLPGGCGFVCGPDGGDPLLYECSPVEQDCGAGQKCVWASVPPHSSLRRDGSRCIEVTGDGQPFEPCTLPNGIGPDLTDDCGPESFCLEVYGTADHGFCAPFMAPDGSCDAHPGTHVAIENGSDFPAACLHYECHPLVADGCPAGMQCTFYPAFLYGAMMCWQVPPQATLPLGAACDFGECGPGQLCAPADWVPGCTDERCCAQWCDLNAPACDDPAAACEPFPVWAGDDPDFEWLGACLLPGALE